MEVHDFRIALADGDEDEEFLSCDEGDEEELPTFSATFEDIFGISRAGIVVGLPCHEAIRRKESWYEKDSLGNVSNNAGGQSDALLTAPSLDDDRDVNTGGGCMPSQDTQLAGWNRMRSLSHAYDRVSKWTDGGKLWSLDEEEEDAEEESDEDDYEFFDSRSSISRIQSVDAGHISMCEVLQRHDKRSPNREFNGQFLQFQDSEEKVKDSDLAEVDQFKKSLITEVDHINSLGSSANECVDSEVTLANNSNVVEDNITEVTQTSSSDVENDQAKNSDISCQIKKSDITEVDCVKNVFIAEIDHVDGDITEVAHFENSNVEVDETKNIDIAVTNSNVETKTSDITQVAWVTNLNVEDIETRIPATTDVAHTKNSNFESKKLDVTEVESVTNSDVEIDESKYLDITGIAQVKSLNVEEDATKNSVITEVDPVVSNVTEVDGLKYSDGEDNQAVNSDYSEIDHFSSDITQAEIWKNSSIEDEHVQTSAVAKVDYVKNSVVDEIDYVNTLDITESDQVNSDVSEIDQVPSDNNEVISVISADVEDDQAKKSVITKLDCVSSNTAEVAHVKNSNVEDDKTKNSDVAESDTLESSDITKEGESRNLDNKDICQVKESYVKEVDHVILFEKTSDSFTEYSPEEKNNNLLSVAQSELEHNMLQKDVSAISETLVCLSDVKLTDSLHSETVDLQSIPTEHGFDFTASVEPKLTIPKVRNEPTSLSAGRSSSGSSKFVECLHPEAEVAAELSAEQVIEVPVESPARLENDTEHTRYLSDHSKAAVLLAYSDSSEITVDRPPDVVLSDVMIEMINERVAPTAHLDNDSENTVELLMSSQASVLRAIPESLKTTDVTKRQANHVQTSSMQACSAAAADVVLDCLKTESVMLETAASESHSLVRSVRPDVGLDTSEANSQHLNEVRAPVVTDVLISGVGLTDREVSFSQGASDTLSNLPVLNNEEQIFLNYSVVSPSSSLNQLHGTLRESQRITDLSLEQCHETLQESPHATSSLLNQLHETLRESPHATSSSLNQLHETLQESPHATSSSVNQLHETLREAPHATSSSLNQLHETLQESPHATNSSVNQLHSTLQESSHIKGSSLKQFHSTLQESPHATSSSMNQLHSTLQESPLVIGSSLAQLPETMQESPYATNPSLNLHETVQESLHVTNSSESEYTSCSHMLQTCSSSALEGSAFQTVHSSVSVNEAIAKVCEEKARNDSQYDQSPDKKPQVELPCDIPAAGNATASVGLHCNNVLVTPELLPDTALRQLSISTSKTSPACLAQNQQPLSPVVNVTNLVYNVDSKDQHWDTTISGGLADTVLEPLSTSANETPPSGLPQNQQPPVFLHRQNTDATSLVQKADANVDDQHRNTNISQPLPDSALRQLSSSTDEMSPGLPQKQQPTVSSHSPNTNIANLFINADANVDDQHWKTSTSELLPDSVLRQLPTLDTLAVGLSQNQQPHVLSQSPDITVTNVIINIGAVTNDQHWNTNPPERLSSEIYSDCLNTDTEEDSVSEDSLGEVCGKSASIDPAWGNTDSTCSSGTHLSDSLEEDSEEDVLDACNNGLTRLEKKPKEIDVDEAKLRASLSWLLAKVYGSCIPKELQDPFYETAEGQLVLRPVMVNLMSTSELYCQACSNMFPEVHTQWQGHWSIIQVLSRKGIYISEVQESAVTETVLVQTAPFRLKAHLALIDALMKAYISEVASVEKVVKAVRRITTFPASSELPATPEEALVFWVNKICTVLGTEDLSRANTEEVTDRAAGQKVRAARASPYPEPVHVPLLEDLMRDVGDGSSVGAVIAFYRPQLLCIKDLILKEGIGTADALYNLQQIGNFCQSYFPCRCFHLSYEDLLYTHNVMKVNILAFLADLFHGFEGPDSFPGQDGGLGSAKASAENIEAMPAAGKKSSQTVQGTVPISQVTKRSFHRPGLDETASNLGMGRSTVTSPLFHQPLLSKRVSGRHCIPQEEGGLSLPASARRSSSRRAQSLSTAQDRDIVHKSVLAWQDDQRLQHRSGVEGSSSNPYNRLSANVSLDSALNRNSNAHSNLGLDFSGLESPRQDFMELESFTPDYPYATHPQPQTDRLGNRTPVATTTDQKLEPLMPALLRPAKEKQISLSKAEESGDRSHRRRKVMPSPEQTPVSLLSQRPTASPISPGGSSQSPYPRTPPQSSRGKAFEAFVVGPDSEVNAELETRSKQANPAQSVMQRIPDISPASSYTVQDRAVSVQAARAAGIPVVSDSEDTLLTAVRSREGSIASSGEYSDHESQKIHQEYKVRESGMITMPDAKMGNTNISNSSSSSNSKPLMLISDHLSGVPTKLEDEDRSLFNKLPSKATTNFAELKRLKDQLGYNLDRMDRSSLIYMQSGSHGGPYDQMSGINLKSSFVNKQGQGQPHSNGDSNKTVGTEQNPQMSRSADMTDNTALEASETNPGSLEMQQLRLKLEQKRKDIERKKHRQEAQHNKMRQQLGKAAFMRVVSKHGDGTVEGDSSDQADSARSDQSPISAQIQLQARLGQLGQNMPVGGTPRHPLPAQLNTLQAAMGQNSVISPDVSAQRFTDWRTQTHMSRGGGGGVSASPSSGNQLTSKDHTQLAQAHVGTFGGSSAGSAYSSTVPETSRNKAFSRAGMQQTIDNIRNNWFKSDTDLISSGRVGSGDEDADGDSFRLHDGDLLAGARPRSIQEQIHTPPRSHSQSPLQGISQPVPTHYLPTQSVPTPVPVCSRETASAPVSDSEYQVYDSSLHKLNSSLTELQGEIMRLSLQHEQFKAAQSPVGGPSPRVGDGSLVGSNPAQSRPIHGIPQQAPFIQGVVTKPNGPSSSNQQPPPLAQNLDVATPPINRDSFSLGASDVSPQTRPGYEREPTSQPRQDASDTEDPMNISNDGFFVSFGDTTPKRLKPRLPEHRARGASPAPNAGLAVGAQTPLTVVSSTEGVSSDVAANLAHQTIVATLNTQRDDDLSDESSSPSIGFMIKDESPATKEAVGDDEMQKKKIKLIEMQRKRKEEQERKRLEKEAETARKLEEKQLKEEEHERKKAEEKARRELIFQQYLQKKQEDEDSPPKPTPKKRDASASKQRPKSMFVKKAMTPEPGALAPDSGSSSQEDLTGRGNMSGRSTPSVMSALRSSFNFRLPQPGNIRKAVSCNTLQGATNGATGPSTYRRPPSPDLSRLKQQRQRGSSQESGSETGSGSNPGSDYAGPKLFVKPSAKSNRHIIVNAISHCCLAGSVNTDMKNKVLEELAKCDANHFLILFRDAGCQYRGLFIFYPETEEAFKVLGVGPKHIVNGMCEKFYKYNSGAKSFSEITSTKHLSVSVDAVVLHTSVWKTGKAVIKR